MLVPGADAMRFQQAVSSHDPKIVFQEPGIAAGTGSGFKHRNSQDHGGRNAIDGRERIGQRAVGGNEFLGRRLGRK